MGYVSPKGPPYRRPYYARSALSASISRSNLINSAGKKGFFKNRTRPPFTAGASSTAPEISSTLTRGFSLNTRSASLFPSISGIEMSEISTSTVSCPQIRSASLGSGADSTLTFCGPSMARSNRSICGSSSTISTVRVASNMELLILYPAVRSSTPPPNDFWDNFIGDPFMPCLLVLLILAFPRVVLLVMYFTSTYLQRAYHDLIIPVLGFFFLPLTTLVYAWLVNSHHPLEGVNLIYLVVAVIIDLGGLGGGESHRRRRL